MTTSEMDKVRDSLIPKHIDSLRHNNNTTNLWVSILLIGLPLLAQHIFLGGESMQDYTYAHPAKTIVVYILGSIGIVMMFAGMILVLPIYFLGQTRNEEVASAKLELMEELKANYENISLDDFTKKISQKSAFIYFNT